MELIWGDDTVALDSAVHADEPTDVVDAATTEVSEILALSGASLFGPRRLVVRNAAEFPADAVARLTAGGTQVVLRCDGNAPAKLRNAVRDAGGTITEHRRARDVAGFSRSHAKTLGLALSRDGANALVAACGADTALARSILEACSIAGITNVGARQVAALSGNAAAVQISAVTSAVRKGDLVAAFAALDATRSDPHAVVGALRRTVAPTAGPEIAEAIADAERRLRSAGRDSAVWVCVERCTTLLAAAPRR